MSCIRARKGKRHLRPMTVYQGVTIHIGRYLDSRIGEVDHGYLPCSDYPTVVNYIRHDSIDRCRGGAGDAVASELGTGN